MNTEEFKEKIYGPYSEAWKILKMIQFAGQSSHDDELWQKYMNEIDRFSKENEGNAFAKDTLVRMLLDAGGNIAKMNGGADEV